MLDKPKTPVKPDPRLPKPEHPIKPDPVEKPDPVTAPRPLARPVIEKTKKNKDDSE